MKKKNPPHSVRFHESSTPPEFQVLIGLRVEWAGQLTPELYMVLFETKVLQIETPAGLLEELVGEELAKEVPPGLATAMRARVGDVLPGFSPAQSLARLCTIPQDPHFELLRGRKFTGTEGNTFVFDGMYGFRPRSGGPEFVMKPM